MRCRRMGRLSLSHPHAATKSACQRAGPHSVGFMSSSLCFPHKEGHFFFPRVVYSFSIFFPSFYIHAIMDPSLKPGKYHIRTTYLKSGGAGGTPAGWGLTAFRLQNSSGKNSGVRDESSTWVVAHQNTSPKRWDDTIWEVVQGSKPGTIKILYARGPSAQPETTPSQVGWGLSVRHKDDGYRNPGSAFVTLVKQTYAITDWKLTSRDGQGRYDVRTVENKNTYTPPRMGLTAWKAHSKRNGASAYAAVHSGTLYVMDWEFVPVGGVTDAEATGVSPGLDVEASSAIEPSQQGSVLYVNGDTDDVQLEPLSLLEEKGTQVDLRTIEVQNLVEKIQAVSLLAQDSQGNVCTPPSSVWARGLTFNNEDGTPTVMDVTFLSHMRHPCMASIQGKPVFYPQGHHEVHLKVVPGDFIQAGPWHVHAFVHGEPSAIHVKPHTKYHFDKEEWKKWTGLPQYQWSFLTHLNVYPMITYPIPLYLESSKKYETVFNTNLAHKAKITQFFESKGVNTKVFTKDNLKIGEIHLVPGGPYGMEMLVVLLRKVDPPSNADWGGVPNCVVS